MTARSAALAPGSGPLPEPVWVEYARTFFPIIVIVLGVRSFVFEPFRIPSDSMMPTLQDGDFIFVNKYAYGLRLPVINAKVTEGHLPERGDVIVFRLPSNPSVNYIKRLVGCPATRRIVRNNQLLREREAPGAADHRVLIRVRRTAAIPDRITGIRCAACDRTARQLSRIR